MRAYIALIRMNLRLTLRDRTVLFFNYVFPLIFFFIFGQLMHAEQGGVVAQMVTGLVHFIPVTFVTLLLARVIYHMPPLEHPLSLYVFVLLGLMAFRAI